MAQRLMLIAYHEAGHAVLARLYGRKVKRVSIQPTEQSLGRVEANSGIGDSIEGSRTARLLHRVEEYVRIQLAGQIAQRQHAPTSHYVYDGRVDRAHAVELLEKITDSQEEATAYLTLLHIQTAQIVKRPRVWAQITAVAEALLKQRNLSGEQFSVLTDQAARDATEKLVETARARIRHRAADDRAGGRTGEPQGGVSNG